MLGEGLKRRDSQGIYGGQLVRGSRKKGRMVVYATLYG